MGLNEVIFFIKESLSQNVSQPLVKLHHLTRIGCLGADVECRSHSPDSAVMHRLRLTAYWAGMYSFFVTYPRSIFKRQRRYLYCNSGIHPGGMKYPRTRQSAGGTDDLPGGTVGAGLNDM